MGRLITSISKEEYEKLPPRQKWMQDHSYLLMFLFILGMLSMALAIEFGMFVFRGWK